MPSTICKPKIIIGKVFNLENFNGKKNISLFIWLVAGTWNEFYLKNFKKCCNFQVIVAILKDPVATLGIKYFTHSYFFLTEKSGIERNE